MYLLLTGLAVWRICKLFIYESGPFQIFEWFREYVNVRHFEDLSDAEQLVLTSNYSEPPELIHDGAFLSELFSCMWCLSIYASAVISIYLSIIGTIGFWEIPVYILAGSAIAILIEVFTDKLGE